MNCKNIIREDIHNGDLFCIECEEGYILSYDKKICLEYSETHCESKDYI